MIAPPHCYDPSLLEDQGWAERWLSLHPPLEFFWHGNTRFSFPIQRAEKCRMKDRKSQTREHSEPTVAFLF